MQDDTLKVVGRVKVRKNGRLVYEGRNLIVTSGLELIAALIEGSGTAPSHMAIGDDGSASALDQTALQGSELKRNTTSKSTSGRESVIEATFGPGLSSAVIVREFGIFNAASAGTMLARFVSEAFEIDSSDNVDVTWTLIVGGTE